MRKALTWSSYYSLLILFPFLLISELPTKQREKIFVTLKQNKTRSFLRRSSGTNSTDSVMDNSGLSSHSFSSLSLSQFTVTPFRKSFNVYNSNLTTKPCWFRLLWVLVPYASICAKKLLCSESNLNWICVMWVRSCVYDFCERLESFVYVQPCSPAPFDYFSFYFDMDHVWVELYKSYILFGTATAMS